MTPGAARVVIVPGIDGSDDAHWQSRWEAELGERASRIDPASWSEPEVDDWVAAIDRAVAPGALVVAHSLGCLAVARWLAASPSARVGGVLMVAPPDATGPAFPRVAAPFAVDARPLGVPTIVVASDDDPYADPAASSAIAAAWGAELVMMHGVGHLNSASGLGAWPEGRGLLSRLAAPAS